MIFNVRMAIFMTVVLLTLGATGATSGTSTTKTADSSDDIAKTVICNVVGFVQRLGLPIMTGVILGSSIMAIFGKLGWPAIVMLVVFTAIFFGASKLINKFAAGVSGLNADSFECTAAP